MRRFARNSGQALVAATVGLVALIGATGLAVDMGYLRYQKRLQQSAADSAAIAGAAEVGYGSVAGAAQQDSTLNGFTDGVNHVTVVVNQPPATGPYAGLTGYVEVLVTAEHPTFFIKIFGVNTATLTARAVAQYAGAKNCVYALEGGLGITNSGTFTAPLCGVVDDGDLLNSGNLTAASVDVHGAASGTATIPGAVTGIVQAADPLAFIPLPAGGGCQTPNFAPNPVILFPGDYCAGINITGAKNVIFSPGVYEVTAGGISFNGTGIITGNGVTFSIAPTGGNVSVNGAPGATQQLNLTAPTTGTNAGVLFYQDPLNLAPASIQGFGTTTLQGALYFPSATLTLGNISSGANGYTIVVGKTLNLSGTLNLGSDYSSLPNGSPIKQAVLVE
jgi:Putative Flp pilus-assembly TadE/G-like